MSVAIYDALKDVGVDIESTLFSKTLREARNWTAKTGKRISGLVPNIYGAGAVVSNASESLQFGEDDLAKIRSALVEQKRRIIIVIDDIDRLDASALPRVLLVVRDLLDLPGFSFLLPFDEAPVIAALQKHISADGSGEGFLEKILDFQFRLPPLSEEQRRSYFRKCAADAADFLPAETIFRLADVLPGTPRRLKSLARHLGLLRATIARHGPNEINWRLLLYAAILRQEDERFASRFLKEFLSDDRSLTLFQGAEEKKTKRDRTLKNIFEQLEIDSLEKRDRLSNICSFGWDQLPRISHQWSDETLALLDRAPAMTQKELIRILGEIRSPMFNVSKLGDLLASDDMNFATGLGRLAATMGSLYRNSIVASIEAFSESDRLAAHSTWLSGISAFEKMAAVAPELPSPSRATLFCNLYDVVISFKDSERESEHIVCREMPIFDRLICSSDQKEVEKIDAHIHRAGKREGYADLAVSDIAQRLAKRVAGDLLERFQRKSIFGFLRLKSQSLYTTVLTQSDGPLWTGETGNLWSAVLDRACDDPVVQKNSVESLELFSNFGSRSCSEIADLISILWKAATVRPVGKMWQEELIKRRDQLVERGVDAECLVVPEWLNPIRLARRAD